MDDFKKIKVLVIDDESETVEMLRIMLEAERFEVLTTTHGLKGVELARTANPDVVLLDLLMPDLDGWQACEAIRRFSQVPILILSAVSKPDLAVRALDAGADDYLLKPMTGRALATHIRRHSSR